MENITQISHAEKLQVIYVYTLLSRKLGITLLLQCGQHIMSFFQKYIQYGNGGKKIKTLTVEKPDKYTSIQVIKVNETS